MKKTILSFVFCTICTAAALAQEALWSGSQVTSPVVNADGTVTFNIFAPFSVMLNITIFMKVTNRYFFE